VRGYHDERIVIEGGRTSVVRVVARPAGQVLFRIGPLAARSREVQVQEGGRKLALTRLDRDVRVAGPSRGESEPVRWLTRQALSPGPHSFVVQVEGYQPAVVTVDVVADEIAEVLVDLQLR
jgi:hypothetical protein